MTYIHIPDALKRDIYGKIAAGSHALDDRPLLTRYLTMAGPLTMIISSLESKREALGRTLEKMLAKYGFDYTGLFFSTHPCRIAAPKGRPAFKSYEMTKSLSSQVNFLRATIHMGCINIVIGATSHEDAYIVTLLRYLKYLATVHLESTLLGHDFELLFSQLTYLAGEGDLAHVLGSISGSTHM